MKSVIHFFRDILDGPVYIIIVLIGMILISICIYKIIKNINQEKELYAQSECNSKNDILISDVNNTVNNFKVQDSNNETIINQENTSLESHDDYNLEEVIINENNNEQHNDYSGDKDNIDSQ